MAVNVRLGGPGDVGAALSVYDRSNLARRRGTWPSRESRMRHVEANLRDPASWFLVGEDETGAVAMAVVLPFRTERGAGQVVPATAFLDLIYVLPDRWGEGIGGTLLDAVLAEATRRGTQRALLWTHERDNERAQRLYESRGFHRTGVMAADEANEPVAEWMREA